MITISNNPKKKYDAICPSGKTVSFGKAGQKHYIDKTPIGCYTYLNTYDDNVRQKFLKKYANNRDENGNLKMFNPELAIYYEIRYLF